MKRTILIVLCLAAVGTFAIAQAQEDTKASDCEGCEETVLDCKDCAGDDCDCDNYTSEEEFQHCGGCH